MLPTSRRRGDSAGIATFFADRRADDLLLLHFSCHGVKDDSGELFFAAANTRFGGWARPRSRPSSSTARMTAAAPGGSCCCWTAATAGAFARGHDGPRRRPGSASASSSAGRGPRGDHRVQRDGVRLRGRRAGRHQGAGASVFTSALVRALETGRGRPRPGRPGLAGRAVRLRVRQGAGGHPQPAADMLSHLEGELYIARSRYVVPVSLPAEVLEALDNPLPQVRAAAVGALVELMRADRRLRSPPASGSRRWPGATTAAAWRRPPNPRSAGRRRKNCAASPKSRLPRLAWPITARRHARRITPRRHLLRIAAARAAGSARDHRRRRAIVAAVSSAVLALSWSFPGTTAMPSRS